jgi:putative exosortase-associated protein (TIGR04073 family)
MKAIATLALTVLCLLPLRADISMPVKDTGYDRFARGIANIAFAPAEILDSNFTILQTEGGTVAFAKGITQGTGRMFSDIGVGLYETLTAPFPVGPHGSYQTDKSPAHGTMTVNEYPPADLTNWY